MSYLVVAILVLLLVGAFVTFLVMNATKRSTRSGTADETAPRDEDGGAPGIGADASPFGDTSEHAGEQAGGRTIDGDDAEEAGGTGGPVAGADSIRDEPVPQAPGDRYQRDPVGGEAEARPYAAAEGDAEER